MPGSSTEESSQGWRSLSFIAKAALVVIAMWALASLVWLARDVLFVAFLAVLLALFLAIFIDRLEAFGLARPLATVVVVLALAGLLSGLGVLAWPVLEQQAAVVRESLPRAVEGLTGWLEGLYRGVFGGPAGEGSLREELRSRFGGDGEATRFISGALPLLNTAVGTVTGLFVVIFAGVYFAASPEPYLNGFTALLPPRHRERVRATLSSAGHTLRWWMLGASISMVIVATLSTAGLLIIGVPAPMVLGAIAGILVFVPIIGPLVSAIPAIAIGFTVSPATALWVALLYAGIQTVESNVLMPVVMRKTVELPPALTVLTQMLMGVLFGFLGVLVAVPFLAASRVFVQDLYVRPMEDPGVR